MSIFDNQQFTFYNPPIMMRGTEAEAGRAQVFTTIRNNVRDRDANFRHVVDVLEGSTGENTKDLDIPTGYGHVEVAINGLVEIFTNPEIDKVRLSDTTLQSILSPEEALQAGAEEWPLRPDRPEVQNQVDDIKVIAGVQDHIEPFDPEAPNKTVEAPTNLAPDIFYREERFQQPPIITVFAVRKNTE
jgi:hypothetical protein